jgi:A/G-specific adenine glycosylase
MRQEKINQFQTMVYEHFRKHGRTFPWRETNDPYAILISEVMSQQTQIERVVPKYLDWIKQWPTVHDLSQATLSEVLALWSGLGYNRRAKLLHELSKVVVLDFDGIIPNQEKDLLSLPGIGPYTAAAIQAFAFNLPVVAVDTNIRSVYIHHFLEGQDQIHDKELMPLIEATKDREQPRIWLSALMDYGAHLKTQRINPINKSLHYSKQAPLKGSVREVRGYILKGLAQKKMVSRKELTTMFDEVRVERAIHGLLKHGLIKTTPGGEIGLGP